MRYLVLLRHSDEDKQPFWVQEVEAKHAEEAREKIRELSETVGGDTVATLYVSHYREEVDLKRGREVQDISGPS